MNLLKHFNAQPTRVHQVSEERKGEFSVHCVRCGKNFFSDTKPTCGGTINGQPMCRTDDIERAMEERLPAAHRELRAAIASVKGCGFDDFRDSCPNYTGFREDHDSDQCTHGKGMEWCEKSDCPRLCLTDTSAKGGAA